MYVITGYIRTNMSTDTAFRTSRKIAKTLRINAHTAYLLLKQKKTASLPLAVRIEKATHGEVKVEQIVRPEVARALKEYLSLRCMSKTSHNGEGEKSLRSKEE